MLRKALEGSSRLSGTRAASHWLDRRIIFIGGKGGVGKTTCAAAFSLLASKTGKRVLLVSTDPAHSTADILEVPLGPTQRRLTENLWAIEIDPEREATAYIESVQTQLLRTTPGHLHTEMERQLEIARVSPGVEEAALFDRMAEIVLSKRDTWDMIVFDTAPIGHTLRLLTLPELLKDWVNGLLRRRRRINQLSTLWRRMISHGSPDEELADPVEHILINRQRKYHQVRNLLTDHKQSTFLFVLTAERLPILETDKAVTLLHKYEIPVGGIIVNRILPENALDHPFFAARKDQERRYLEEIDRAFPDITRLNLPLLPHDVVGREPLLQVVEHIGQAMGVATANRAA